MTAFLALFTSGLAPAFRDATVTRRFQLVTVFEHLLVALGFFRHPTRFVVSHTQCPIRALRPLAEDCIQLAP